jgi:hypothetical protein
MFHSKLSTIHVSLGVITHESSVNSRTLTNERLLDYIHVDMPLMIPALSFSDVLFSNTFQLAPLSQSQDMSSDS